MTRDEFFIKLSDRMYDIPVDSVPVEAADFLMPVIDAYLAAERERLVQAIAQARAETAEQIAQAIEDLKVKSPHPDVVLAAAYHTAVDDAAHRARQHARKVGSDE